MVRPVSAHLSELDGWRAEAYTPEVGWSLGDGAEHGDEGTWDGAEAGALYDRLEQEVIPEFYRRDGAGVPTAWTARMRESMSRLTPQFSADRAVKDYTERFYLPAATAYQSRTAEHGAAGRRIVAWQSDLEQCWATLRFGAVTVEGASEQHQFTVEVYLGGLDASAVQVELYAQGENGAGATHVVMTPGRTSLGETSLGETSRGEITFYASVPASRPAADYTPRVVPLHPDAVVPLECQRILWQR